MYKLSLFMCSWLITLFGCWRDNTTQQILYCFYSCTPTVITVKYGTFQYDHEFIKWRTHNFINGRLVQCKVCQLVYGVWWLAKYNAGRHEVGLARYPQLSAICKVLPRSNYSGWLIQVGHLILLGKHLKGERNLSSQCISLHLTIILCEWKFHVFKIQPISTYSIFVIINLYKVSGYSGGVTLKRQGENLHVCFQYGLCYCIYHWILMILFIY